MDEIVIVAAARTPQGRLLGALSLPLRPAARRPRASRGRSRAAASTRPWVDAVIMGQVLSAGFGPEPGPPGGDRCRDRLGRAGARASTRCAHSRA